MQCKITVSNIFKLRSPNDALCSINVPFKVASLTSAWKASVSFSATKTGSTSTPKHNFSGEKHRGFAVIVISGLCPEASGQRQTLSEGLVPETNKKETVCFQKPQKSPRIAKNH